MSFILDALRKSERERQRSAVPGLTQVPVAAPQPRLPGWAVAVIGVLAVAVVALGAAWWQSRRTANEAGAASAATVERRVELPPRAAAGGVEPPHVAPRPTAAQRAMPEPARPDSEPPLARAAAPAPGSDRLTEAAPATGGPGQAAPAATTGAAGLAAPLADFRSLPSAAALAAEGVAVPELRLELHAWSSVARDRFVFINGRKYVEGERLVEGPQLVSIEPTGVVLAYSGRRFLLLQQ